MKNVNCLALSAVDTSTQIGSAIVADQLVSASFQTIFADATVIGVVKIQASNDINNAMYNNGFVPTNWTDIPSATAAVTAGTSTLITLNNVVYQYLRVVFTYTSGGSSTIIVKMSAFGI